MDLRFACESLLPAFQPSYATRQDQSCEHRLVTRRDGQRGSLQTRSSMRAGSQVQGTERRNGSRPSQGLISVLPTQCCVA